MQSKRVSDDWFDGLFLLRGKDVGTSEWIMSILQAVMKRGPHRCCTFGGQMHLWLRHAGERACIKECILVRVVICVVVGVQSHGVFPVKNRKINAFATLLSTSIRSCGLIQVKAYFLLGPSKGCTDLRDGWTFSQGVHCRTWEICIHSMLISSVFFLLFRISMQTCRKS